MTEHNIFAIKSSKTDKIYIGSTIEPIDKRFQMYKALYRLYKDGKKIHYNTIFDMLQYPCSIELLQTVVGASRIEINQIKGNIIKNTKNCINNVINTYSNGNYYKQSIVMVQCVCGKRLNEKYLANHMTRNTHLKAVGGISPEKTMEAKKYKVIQPTLKKVEQILKIEFI